MPSRSRWNRLTGLRRWHRKNLRKFILYIALIPVLTLLGGWIGAKSHVFLSRVHSDVYLAELMISNPELREDEENLDIQAFLESGDTFEQLVDQAAVIREKFRKKEDGPWVDLWGWHWGLP